MSSPSSGGTVSPSPSPSPAPSGECSTVVGGYCYNVISTSQLTTSLWLSAAAGGLILLIFIYIRGTRTWRPVLHKRATQICDLLYRPPPLGLSGWSRIWSWLSPVFLLSDEDLLLTAGLDALTLVRFLQMGMHVYLMSTIIGCAVLLPLYRTGGDIYSGRTTANSDELMLWTLSNVSPGSSRLWAAWACMIAFTMYVCWVLWIHSRSHAVLQVLHNHRFSLLMPQGNSKNAEERQGPTMWLVGRPEKSSTMARLWKSIVCIISPVSMLNSDIHMIKSRIKEYEERFVAENKIGSGSELKICELKVTDDGDTSKNGATGSKLDNDDEGTNAVLPWWLSPEDVPSRVNSILIPGGLALGKSPAECRARIESTSGSLVPTAAYVVLFRAVMKRKLDNFWNDLISVQRRIAIYELENVQATSAVVKCGTQEETAALPESDEGKMGMGQDLEGALRETLRAYFPTSFQDVIPVYQHRATDVAIQNWDEVSAQLARLEGQISRISNPKRNAYDDNNQDDGVNGTRDLENGNNHSRHKAQHSRPRCGCLGSQKARQDKRLQKLLAKKDTLESKFIEAKIQVVQCRKKELANPLGTAYFALFNSQRDAVFAVRANVAEGLGLKAEPAPGPDDVNWSGGLWARWQEQAFRKTLSLIAMIVFIIFPIGALTGALANLPLALCGGTSDTNNLYSSWFCGTDNGSGFVKILLTGLLPVAISTFWDTWVSPMFFYLAIQSQRCHASLSGLDIDATKGFYAFALINTFIEGVLGGAFLQQVGSAAARGKVASLFGTALPAASNFFLNYIGIHALFTNPFRFVWPHDGTVLFVFLRAIGLHRPQCERDEWIIRSPPSYRGARHFGSFLAIYIMSASYATVAPIILPITLMFFFTAYISWRYAAFQFYEPCFEGGGKMWNLMFQLMIITLWIANVFAGCVFIAKSGFWIGGSLIIVASLLLAMFRRACVLNVDGDLVSVGRLNGGGPRSTFWAPAAHVPRELYLPPPLREGAVGWFPEWGKLWEKYAIPRYTM